MSDHNDEASTHNPLRARAELTPPSPARAPRSPDTAWEAAETTRYLCAATHIDRGFRELVIKELLDEPHRAICPSYGVDLATVAAHAVSARRRYALRDGVLFCLLLTLLLVAVLTAGSAEPAGTRVVGAAIFVLLAAWMVVAATRFMERCVILGRQLGRPAHRIPKPRLSMTASLRARLAAIESAQNGNVTVFSGYRPFVGSGSVFGRWSFAIDIERGKTDAFGNVRSPKPFDAADLYDALAASLDRTGIPRLRIEERLFVHGRDVKRYPSLLPHRYGRPAAHADQAFLRRALALNLDSARTYLSVQATSWQGHLVATMFFRAVRLPSALYLEGTSTALLPLSQDFANVLDGPRDATGLAADAFRVATLQTLPNLMASPYVVANAALGAMGARRRRREARLQISEGEFDYGAVTSIRERAAGETFNRYYLEYDRDMYEKVVSERLLQHVLEFLDAHDVDTSALAGHMTTINNQNTYNNQQHINGHVTGSVTGGGSSVHGGLHTTASNT
jgi:hypothetical protein